MNFLEIAWNYTLPVLGGVTIGSIVVFIVVLFLKSFVTKTVSKIDIEGIEKKAVEKGVDKIKNISITQNIQPILESGLMRVEERANEHIRSAFCEVTNGYKNIAVCLANLAAYFDNSIAVSDEAKERLKKSIEVALGECKEEPKEIDTKVEDSVPEVPFPDVEPATVVR